MSSTDLNNIANNLYMLLISLNKGLFNSGELLKRFRFPASHIKVLFYLIYKKSASISEIANDLTISKPNMTPILDKLESEDLIRRVNDQTDRRIIRIEATENACTFLKEQESTVKEHLLNKISHLSVEDTEKLNYLIQEMNILILKL